MFMEYTFFQPDLEGKFAISNLGIASSISVIKWGCLFYVYLSLYIPFSIRKSDSDSREATPWIT